MGAQIPPRLPNSRCGVVQKIRSINQHTLVAAAQVGGNALRAGEMRVGESGGPPPQTYQNRVR